MSTIRRIIDRVNENKPNVLSQSTLVAWLAELDGKIAMSVFLLDIVELSQFQYDPVNDLDRDLLVKFPHDDIYYYWLCAKIDAENGEYNKYQNTMQLYNASYSNFVQWFLTAYEPSQGGCLQHRNATHYISAYGLAVERGFRGTVDEWLLSLGGKQGVQGAPGPAGNDGKTPERGVDYWTPNDMQKMLNDVLLSSQFQSLAGDVDDLVVDNIAIKQALDKIQADLDYNEIVINSFTKNVNSTYEKGAVLSSVYLSWKLSKEPAIQDINGVELDVDDRGQNMPGPINKDVTFRLTVADERGAVATATTSISFVSRVYYGLLADGTAINSGSIKSLNSKLQGSRGVTFNVAPTSLMRIAYAIPASGYGTPTFKASNGFAVDMYRLEDPILVENDLGYVEQYYVWLSTYLQDQASTVIVS